MFKKSWGKSAVRAVWAAALVASQVALAAGPPIKPNAERYHVKPGQKATGRAGSASLEARALVARDRTVQLEATTGVLDTSAQPPGYLSRLALKAYDGEGRLVLNREFNGLTGTGYRSYAVNELVRGQPFQVQASIRGLDATRTDIITVSGTTLLRPDLELAAIDVPARARPGALVNVSAMVRETNGDVGATGDCVLMVDGVEADRANGIWVDAGGAVSCAFTTRFATTGQHTVGVVLSGQVPADFEAGNNAMSAQIEVTNPDPVELSYWAGASRYSYESSYRGFGSYSASYQQQSYTSGGDGGVTWGDGGTLVNAGGEWSYDTGYRYVSEGAYLQGYTQRELTFPIDSIRVAFASDATPAATVSFENVAADYSYSDIWWGSGYRYACANRWSSEHSISLYLCSVSGPWGASTSIAASRYAGQAIYWSRSFARYWFSSSEGSGEYVWSYNVEYRSGGDGGFSGGFGIGSNVTIDLQVRDDGTLYQAQPNIALTQSYSFDYGSPRTCSESSWQGYSQSYCWESVYRYTSAYGYAVHF